MINRSRLASIIALAGIARGASMNIDHKALKGVVDEIEASRARQKGETEFQREALKAAVKNHQLDAKAIRIVLQRRAMGEEKRDEQDYYVHAYEMALGGKKLAVDALASGATIREAAAIGGISTGAAGNLAKVVQKSPKMDTPHDADGVVTETQRGLGPNAVPEETNQPRQAAPPAIDSPAAKASDAESPSGPLTSTDLADAAGGVDAPALHLNEAPAPRSVGAVVREPATERVASPFMGDDPGPPPSFLRGRAA